MSFVASGGNLRLKSVLVATDLSEASQKPLSHALAIARHYGAKFYLAHVVSTLGYTIAGPEALELASEATLKELQQLKLRLSESGALAGLDHEFVVSQGVVCEELQKMIAQKEIDLAVLGTHGRHGFGKLLLGSVADQVFRHANCLVLTVGPRSYQEARPEDRHRSHSILFATDFGEASLHALPYAISMASHYGAKLILLHILPAAPMPEGSGLSSADNLTSMREYARMAGMRRREQLPTYNEELAFQLEFLVEFGLPSEKILQVASDLKVDFIVMGLRRSPHIGTASHIQTIAYEVVCGAGCPVLTVGR